MYDFARELIEEYDVRASSEYVATKSLSGGNQQKAIIARRYTVIQIS